ncbi:MAG: hypothetical protein IPG12_04695 [Saprospiraceae bacterium]|nr:hypothetical protein [Saprospiraceae bacterium]
MNHTSDTFLNVKILNYYFLIFPLFLLACKEIKNTEKTSEPINIESHRFEGIYYNTGTGEIPFEIVKDSVGYSIMSRQFDDKSDTDKRIKMMVVDEAFKKMGGYCGKSFEIWLSYIIGGTNWHESLEASLITVEGRDNVVLLKMKKGYRSKEHNYSSGYALVSGSECFKTYQTRINLMKID